MSNSTTAPLWPLENASPIIWNAADRSFILSAFFYGYVILQVCSHSIRFIRCSLEYTNCPHKITKKYGSACFENQNYWMQVPGGRMAEMYGTKKVLGYRSSLVSLKLSKNLLIAKITVCWWPPFLVSWPPWLLTQVTTSYLPSLLLRLCLPK